MNKLGKALPPLASLLPFEAAARLGSFTRAAEELHLTQAAVSRQIRALEVNLGVSLFERRQRAVFLTEAGRDLARTVSAGLESIAARASDLRGSRRSGEVVLFVELYFAFYWLTPRLAGFRERHPGIELRIAASTLSLAQSSEDFDLAIQATERDSGAHGLVFSAADEILPVCSPGYLAGRPTPLDLATLSDHRLLHFRSEACDWLGWNGWLERQGRALRVADKGAIFDSYPVLVQSAIEGHGIGLGWRRALTDLLRSGSLVRPFAESLHLPEGLSVYRRHDTRLRPEAEALLSWLSEELGEDPEDDLAATG